LLLVFACAPSDGTNPVRMSLNRAVSMCGDALFDLSMNYNINW
jgi:hypothetical protein